MKATEELIHEHESVLVALQILDRVSASIGIQDLQAQVHLEQLLDFFRGFVDRCHHGKEEDVLFPELINRGISREGGPIGVMLMEHEIGRGHVRALADDLESLRRGETESVTRIAKHVEAYGELLRAHIYKENHALFPMADRIVPEEAAARLAEQYEGIERQRVGPGKHEAYHAMLHTLKNHYGIV